MNKEQQQQELAKLREATSAFYASTAGLAQLQWLDTFEKNLVQSAITASDNTVRISCLDQAKGVRAFRAYLETLVPKD